MSRHKHKILLVRLKNGEKYIMDGINLFSYDLSKRPDVRYVLEAEEDMNGVYVFENGKCTDLFF